MKIDGKTIASEILEDLKIRVKKLKTKGVVPHLYVILLINDPSTLSYIKQKKIKSEQLGAKITIDDSNPDISTEELLKKIEKLNMDKSIHGIIVQKPLPSRFDDAKITNAISAEKDVDGFRKDSKFGIPVGLAVLEILSRVYEQIIKEQRTKIKELSFKDWIKSQKITVIGKGQTAGGPIIRTLQNLGTSPVVVSSKTDSIEDVIKNSDVIVSAVGKANIVNKKNIKKGAILIGVGMHTEGGKLKGDYEESDIENIAGFYTPTPGGVGPVNVSCLMKNLVIASEMIY